MEKFLVTFEFRYNHTPDKLDITSSTKIITVGVYNTFQNACTCGNNELEKLENIFKIHTFPSGLRAKKERFSLNGGCFGSKVILISNLAYLKTPFDFYAKITTLNHSSVETEAKTLTNLENEYKRFKNK